MYQATQQKQFIKHLLLIIMLVTIISNNYYNDQSTKQVANTNYVKSETYTGSLNVSIDPYFDRHIYNHNGLILTKVFFSN